jgi:AraC family transcriptional regulator
MRRDSPLSAVSPLAWQVVAEVLVRMQTDLDRVWTLEDAAASAGYEQHHFAHSFRAVVGEPPLAYLRRLRLERAAHQLVSDPTQPVATIARQAGYASLEAFSRAFRRAFGSSPRSFRRTASRRAGGSPEAPVPEADASLSYPTGLSPNPRIEAVGPVRGWTALVESFDDVEAVARAMVPLLMACPPDGPWQLGGVAQPWGWQTDEARRELRLLRVVGPDAPPPEPPLLAWRMPRGWFACFDYHGPHAGIAPACTWIMEEWIPRSGLRQAFAPVLSLLEGGLDPKATRAQLHAPVERLSSAATGR